MAADLGRLFSSPQRIFGRQNLAAASKIDPSAGAHSHPPPRFVPSVLRRSDHFTSIDDGLEPAISVGADDDSATTEIRRFRRFSGGKFQNSLKTCVRLPIEDH
jgi:hypothetical protein